MTSSYLPFMWFCVTSLTNDRISVRTVIDSFFHPIIGELIFKDLGCPRYQSRHRGWSQTTLHRYILAFMELTVITKKNTLNMYLFKYVVISLKLFKVLQRGSQGHYENIQKRI